MKAEMVVPAARDAAKDNFPVDKKEFNAYSKIYNLFIKRL